MKHLVLAVCLAATVLVAGAACSSAKDRGGNWVNLVQAAHRSADAASSVGLDETERALRAALASAPDAPNERERWVIQDLYYRLAQLLVDRGVQDQAEGQIAKGLQVDAAPTLARANLLALRGKVLERQGQQEAASEAYHSALLINEVLMDRALNGTGDVEPREP